IFAGTVNVNNAGRISGGAFGIHGDTVNVASNPGTIQATDTNGTGIFAAGTATVTSSGTISATGGGTARAIEAGDVKVNGNTGTISGSQTGIFATNGAGHTGTGSADVANNFGGIISGGIFGIDADTVNVDNAGTIAGAFGISAA